MSIRNANSSPCCAATRRMRCQQTADPQLLKQANIEECIRSYSVTIVVPIYKLGKPSTLLLYCSDLVSVKPKDRDHTHSMTVSSCSWRDGSFTASNLGKEFHVFGWQVENLLAVHELSYSFLMRQGIFNFPETPPDAYRICQ